MMEFAYEKQRNISMIPSMNRESPQSIDQFVSAKKLFVRAAGFVVLLWLSQPPVAWWPLAMVALVPLLDLSDLSGKFSRRSYFVLWATFTCYWLVSLQGLRHAHPAMVLCLIALSCYLAIYHVLFVVLLRQAKTLVSNLNTARENRKWGSRIVVVAAAAMVWVGLELMRNYAISGISVLMLGHTMADVPRMIQVADTFGSYGVSFVLVQVNVAVWFVLRWFLSKKANSRVDLEPITTRELSVACSIAIVMLFANIAYGTYRLSQPLGESRNTFALIQRNEVVEYVQSEDRQVEMFQNYATQSFKTLSATDSEIDAVVWPESMFSGGQPWVVAEQGASLPEAPAGQPAISRAEFTDWVKSRQSYFLERAGYIQKELARQNPSKQPPSLLAGCGVIRYAEKPEMYSGLVHVMPDVARTPTAASIDWYGKTHLVMFGETIPVVSSIPFLKSLVPPGLGLNVGEGPSRMTIGETAVAPNICVETAVERVAVNQLRTLRSSGSIPDVMVTVTNDGWFDDSSVIDHHLRCAQLVAVGCRRPILSAANNGPTAWIDSTGRIVERLAKGENGAVIAKPNLDSRVSPYIKIADWPAALCALLCIVIAIMTRQREKARAQSA